MCFAPQRRALFRHRNFQKWSEPGVFCTFLTSKCASCHKGVHFFISHLARWLRTRRFSEPTFRLSGATNHWKNIVFRDFPTFSRIWASFFWLFLFSDLLSSTLLFSVTLPVSAFHLSILSEVWLLNFLRLQYHQFGSIIPLNTITIPIIKNLPSLNSNQVQWIVYCVPRESYASSSCAKTQWWSLRLARPSSGPSGWSSGAMGGSWAATWGRFLKQQIWMETHRNGWKWIDPWIKMDRTANRNVDRM